MKIENCKFKIILLLIIATGAFLRFYKLDWGNGLFAHPDEYHIAAAVNQLSFPEQMHPHFFSYGTVIIYLIYFTKELLAFLNSHLSYSNALLIGRFYSAFFGTLTILFVYRISNMFLKKSWSLLAAFFIALTPGLIQQAHFVTPESTLTCFLLASLLFLLYFLQQKKLRFLFIASVFFGLALGVKISALVFLLPILAGIILQSWKKPLRLILLAIGSVIITTATFALVAPYAFLDFPAFWGNVRYEGALARGTISVFYTRQFIDTVPILFQLEKILPYALGLPLLVTGVLGFFVSILYGTHRRDRMLLLIIIAFLSLFLPNAFLFAKWTRFIASTFPFFSLFAVFFLSQITKKDNMLGHLFVGILLIGTITWTFAFFSIYTNHDVRITTSNWLVSHLPEKSTILVESGNTIDLPLSGNYQKLSLNFYAIEDNVHERQNIVRALATSDYFLVQSRRVFLNHMRLPKQFPKTAHFYDTLFSNQLGFQQIQEFHSYPKISMGTFSFELPDEQAEETWSVFDHPVIRVFKKERQLTREEYQQFLYD